MSYSPQQIEILQKIALQSESPEQFQILHDTYPNERPRRWLVVVILPIKKENRSKHLNHICKKILSKNDEINFHLLKAEEDFVRSFADETEIKNRYKISHYTGYDSLVNNAKNIDSFYCNAAIQKTSNKPVLKFGRELLHPHYFKNVMSVWEEGGLLRPSTHQLDWMGWHGTGSLANINVESIPELSAKQRHFVHYFMNEIFLPRKLKENTKKRDNLFLIKSNGHLQDIFKTKKKICLIARNGKFSREWAYKLAENNNNIFFVIKDHPVQHILTPNDLKLTMGHNWICLSHLSKYDTQTIAMHSDYVIVENSTVGFEALYWTPVFAAVKTAFSHSQISYSIKEFGSNIKPQKKSDLEKFLYYAITCYHYTPEIHGSSLRRWLDYTDDYRKRVYSDSKISLEGIPTAKGSWIKPEFKTISPPSIIQIELTKNCNNACIMCHKGQIPEGSDFNRSDISETTLKQIRPVYPYLKHAMLFGDGEPMMFKGFWNVVQEIRDASPKCAIDFINNGSQMNKLNANKCLEYQVSQVGLSLGGATPQTHNKIRKLSDLNQVIKNFEYLKQLKKDNETKEPYLHILIVVMKSNLHELPELIKLADHLGAIKVTFQKLFVTHSMVLPEVVEDHEVKPIFHQSTEIAESIGMGLTHYINTMRQVQTKLNRINPDDLIFRQKFDPSTQPNGYCKAQQPWNTAYILHTGAVVPDCHWWLSNNHPQLNMCGTLNNENDILDIWNGHIYQQIRKSIAQGEILPQCRGCGLAGGVKDKYRSAATDHTSPQNNPLQEIAYQSVTKEEKKIYHQINSMYNSM